MTKKFFRNWLISFIVLVIIDVLWHRFILGSFYGDAAAGIQRVVNDRLAPLIQFIILGDVLVSFGYAYLITLSSALNKKYVLNGLIIGLVLTGSYSIYNYALIPNWPAALTVVDVINGMVFGAIQGLLIKYLDRGGEAKAANPVL